MYWQYRVIETVLPDGNFTFSICEVYFNEENKIEGWIEKGAYLGDIDNFEELIADVELLRKALSKPVLTLRNDTLTEKLDV